MNFLKFLDIRRTKNNREISTPRRGFSWNIGVPVNVESAMQVSAYHRGVTYLASQIGKLPWQIKNKNNEVIQSEVAFLLELAPNPEMSSMDLRMFLIQSALNFGNGYAEIERNITGRPVAIWPIEHNRVQPMRTTAGDLVYRITNEVGGDAFIPSRDMLHIKNFYTKDGIVGQGLVAYAIEILGISIGADRLANNLFANGGLPSGVISVTGALDDEAYKRIKDSWTAAHGGRKSGGVAVLEEGAKYDSVSMDPHMLQFLESRKFNVIEIARFLGLPPTKLFDTQAATYSNTENANLEVVTDTIDAWAKQFEFQTDIKVLNNRYGGFKSELDLYAVSRGDMETRAKYFNTMVQIGSITPNEIRSKEGMAPYDKGNEFYIAANNLSPVSRIDEIIQAQIDKGKSQKIENNPTIQNPNNNMFEQEVKLLKAIFRPGKDDE